MKTYPSVSCGLALFGLTFARLAAASLEVNPSHADGVYHQGERVVWSVASKDDPEKTITSVRYKITQDGGQLLREGALDLTDGRGEIDIVENQPGVILVELNAGGGDQPKQHVFGAAAIDPAKIPRSAPRPADFDEFWNKQLAALAKVPMNAQLTPGKSDRPGVAHWLVTLDLPNGQKAMGQLARPETGTKFPAMLIVQYAGVYGLPPGKVTSPAANGWLALNLSAHELPLNEPEPFYKDQDAGPLKNYAMLGSDDREKSYFLRMFLACSRAVDYLASRPDWDGRTLVVTGTSQGGLQAVVAAGLNPKVTAFIVKVPAGCDTTAPLVGRAMSWPYWFKEQPGKDRNAVQRTSSYFDAQNFAQRVKCPALVGFGLLDRTATASGVFQMIGQLRGPVEPVILIKSDHKGTGGTQAAIDTRSNEWLAALKTGKTPAKAARP